MQEMRLETRIVKITDIDFGDETKVLNGTLQINKKELLEYLSDQRFATMDVELARPGESVRIIPVKDVIEPRIKVGEGGGSFPGFLGGFDGVGEGSTVVLEGCGVVTTGKIVGFQEGIIDMKGVVAEHTDYSKLYNVVVNADPVADISPAEHEEAIRIAGLKAAHYLAQAGLQVEPDRVDVYELEPVSEDLPKVAIMYMVIAQGLLHDNYVYGADAKTINPTILHPNELMDGAVVNGTCVVAADKQTTYRHQNSAIIKDLYERHGKDLNFVGAIIVPSKPQLKEKERCCIGAVNIARTVGVDGVIIQEEGGGNPEADVMMMCRHCEKNDIKTVILITLEDPLADTTPEADAVIDVGEDMEMVQALPMDRIIGHEEQVQLLSGAPENCLAEDGTITIPLYVITGLHGDLVGSYVRGVTY